MQTTGATEQATAQPVRFNGSDGSEGTTLRLKLADRVVASFATDHHQLSRGLPRLGARERMVLARALAGFEDKEIAESLGISLSSVHTYWARLYRKTGISSRRRLMAHAWFCAATPSGPLDSLMDVGGA